MKLVKLITAVTAITRRTRRQAEEANYRMRRQGQSLNERAEAENESGSQQLNAVTPRCGQVVTVVEQANNRQGAAKQGEGQRQQALANEQRHTGRG